MATVSVEDENFYSSAFLDVIKGAGRAALASLQTSEDPGGSTIAQQLAKRLYPHGGGLGGTLEEIGLGVKLSLRYSHDQVLDMYLDSIYSGNGYWGAVAAARGYFGTPVRELSWGEAAMLAGLPQAPSAYDPIEHLALARQRHVLDQLAPVCGAPFFRYAKGRRPQRSSSSETTSRSNGSSAARRRR